MTVAWFVGLGFTLTVAKVDQRSCCVPVTDVDSQVRTSGRYLGVSPIAIPGSPVATLRRLEQALLGFPGSPVGTFEGRLGEYPVPFRR